MEFSHIIDEFAKDNNLSLAPIEVKGGITAYHTAHDGLLSLLKFVKEHKELRFAILTDLFAADFPAKTKRFEVVYNLLSLQLNKRLLFKIDLDEEDSAPSIADLYSAACWYEREAFDMFGINFENCPDMRRILTDYGFKGHPLRKDFPLTGHVQIKYDEVLKKVVYEPVLLEQEFRNFDFSSPWQGPSDYKLPGDEKSTK